MTKKMSRLLLVLRKKVMIMLNGHDEHSRKAWIELVDEIEQEARGW